MTPATFLSREQPLVGERRVLDVLERAVEPGGLKLQDIADRAQMSVRAVSEYVRVLRGKGKVERVKGKGHDIFYRRRRYA